MGSQSDIHGDAIIGRNVEIGPFTTVSGNVEIGEGTWIGPNVIIYDGVKIGNNCRIHPGAILGGDPQDLKYDNENSFLDIGNNVTIREFCTLNRGTKANNKTVIKDNVLLMAYVHIAHDCIIDHDAVLANNVNLAGHVEIGKYSILGGFVAVHQFAKIGEFVMIGGGSLVRKDVPPYVKAAREPLSYVGVNSIGLRRKGFSNSVINHIQDIYRILYVNGYNTTQAIRLIEATIQATPEREVILNFIHNSHRGIMRGFRPTNN